MKEYNNNLFEEIYDTYYNNVYKYIYMYVKDKKNTEHIISLAFNSILGNLNKYTNLAEGKFLLFSKAHSLIEEFNKTKVICFSNSISKNILSSTTKNSMEIALEKLPENLKELMILKYYGGLDSYEISKVLNISHNLIDYRLLKATEKTETIIQFTKQGSS